jgi:signal transduction histidine kinase
VDGRGANPVDSAEAGALPHAVHHGVAEVRARNALVVAWARAALRALTLALLVLGELRNEHPQVSGWVVWINALHLAFSCAAIVLLRRRWRTGAVALVAAVLDLVMMFGWGLHATAAGVRSGPGSAEVALLGGAMQVQVLFAAVALPAVQAAPLALAAIVYQIVLGVRTGMPLADNALLATTAAAFALVAIWTGLRIIRLAAGMAVEATTAELAERHARALEAAHGEVAAQRDQLISAQNEAEALAQVIVHDLKNPLATLLQYVSLAEAELRSVRSAETAVDYLGHAGDEGRRLSKLIGDLLLVYRLEQGVMAPARESVLVALLVDAVVQRFRARATDRGVTLELVAEDGLVASLDLDLVQRLLENLVANALRHVGRGDHVSVEARSGDGQLLLAVRNSGPPVPAELRESLFRRFVTGGMREWHNAGLGLYLCRLVAEAHGGTIALAERTGWNVSFEIAIPSPARRESPTETTRAATG